MLRQRGDVLAGEDDRALARLEHAGQQIDQRRLAGAVGADQRVARAGLERQRHVVGDREAAETPEQAARLQRRAHGAASRRGAGRSRRASRFSAASTRSRPTVTSATSIRPIQNSQYSGVAPASASRKPMKIAAPINPP